MSHPTAGLVAARCSADGMPSPKPCTAANSDPIGTSDVNPTLDR